MKKLLLVLFICVATSSSNVLMAGLEQLFGKAPAIRALAGRSTFTSGVRTLTTLQRRNPLRSHDFKNSRPTLTQGLSPYCSKAVTTMVVKESMRWTTKNRLYEGKELRRGPTVKREILNLIKKGVDGPEFKVLIEIIGQMSESEINRIFGIECLGLDGKTLLVYFADKYLRHNLGEFKPFKAQNIRTIYALLKVLHKKDNMSFLMGRRGQSLNRLLHDEIKDYLLWWVQSFTHKEFYELIFKEHGKNLKFLKLTKNKGVYSSKVSTTFYDAINIREVKESSDLDVDPYEIIEEALGALLNGDTSWEFVFELLDDIMTLSYEIPFRETNESMPLYLKSTLNFLPWASHTLPASNYESQKRLLDLYKKRTRR